MDDELVTVATFWYSHEAELAKVHLAEAGIASLVFDDLMTSFGYYGNATGGVKLQVAKGDVETALAVMAEWPKPRDRSVEESAGVDTLRCLSCGKRMLEDQIECEECGWSYADAVDESADATELPSNIRDWKPRPRPEPPAEEEQVEPPDSRIQRDRPPPRPKRPDA
jgi:hypothetical protein